MAESQRKTVNTRIWPLPAVNNEPMELRITHTTTVRDAGLPTESTEHNYEAEVAWMRQKITITSASSQTEFDANLNTWRQIIVDVRSNLATL